MPRAISQKKAAARAGNFYRVMFQVRVGDFVRFSGTQRVKLHQMVR